MLKKNGKNTRTHIFKKQIQKRDINKKNKMSRKLLLSLCTLEKKVEKINRIENRRSAKHFPMHNVGTHTHCTSTPTI